MNKRILHISLFLMLASTANVFAQQGIGTHTPHRSAALQIESQNKGILIPRMNLGYDAVNNKITSNISSPVQGLLVYNQTSITNVPEGFYYYSDGKWNPISKSYLENSDHTTILGDGSAATPYKVELKPATASQLGGVKIGQNINVSTDGTISVSFPASTVDTNTTTTVSTDQSYVNVDLTQTVGQDSDPINTRNYKIGVKPATTSTLGVVQPGTGLTVNDGVLNVNTSNTGIGKTLTGSGITVTASSSGEITNSVANSVLADVTLGIADNAVTTDKILDGTIATADLGNKSVTAIKLDAGTGVANRLAIADATGNVTYSTISTSILTDAGNLTSVTGDNSITVSDGNGATLKNTNIKVSDLGISTAKLAADAVTAAKINADVAGNGLVQNTNGALDVNVINGLKIENDAVKLGGALTEPTTITTTTTNNLKITGLENTKQVDSTVVTTGNTSTLTNSTINKVLVVDANHTVKTVNAVMPEFFYMPSIVINTQSTSVDLYQQYLNQFGNPMISNTNNEGKLPVLNRNMLDYHVTYYDNTVLTNVSINNNGVMNYTVSTTPTNMTFINVVFKVRSTPNTVNP